MWRYSHEGSGTPTIYLLHFSERFGHAQHYLGYTKSLKNRLHAHREGRGARLVRHAKEAGISVSLARIWRPADRWIEKRMKGHGRNGRTTGSSRGWAKYCPICRGKPAICEMCEARAERGVRFCRDCKPQVQSLSA